MKRSLFVVICIVLLTCVYCSLTPYSRKNNSFKMDKVVLEIKNGKQLERVGRFRDAALQYLYEGRSAGEIESKKRSYVQAARCWIEIYHFEEAGYVFNEATELIHDVDFAYICAISALYCWAEHGNSERNLQKRRRLIARSLQRFDYTFIQSRNNINDDGKFTFVNREYLLQIKRVITPLKRLEYINNVTLGNTLETFSRLLVDEFMQIKRHGKWEKSVHEIVEIQKGRIRCIDNLIQGCFILKDEQRIYRYHGSNMYKRIADNLEKQPFLTGKRVYQKEEMQTYLMVDECLRMSIEQMTLYFAHKKQLVENDYGKELMALFYRRGIIHTKISQKTQQSVPLVLSSELKKDRSIAGEDLLPVSQINIYERAFSVAQSLEIPINTSLNYMIEKVKEIKPNSISLKNYLSHIKTKKKNRL